MANDKKSFSDRLKSGEHWKREGMNTLFVATGLVGATLIDRLVQKAADKWFPSIAPYVGYVKAGTSVIGGLVLSVTSDEKTPEGDRMRLIGYGISGSGLISGLRLFPAIDNLMSDNTTTTTTPPVNGVERLLGLNLGGFGNAENIKEISTADAEKIDLDLPDLGYVDSYENSEDTNSEYEVEDIAAEVI